MYCDGLLPRVWDGHEDVDRGLRGEGVWERDWVNGTISSKGTWVREAISQKL